MSDKLRILVIDDDRRMAKTLVDILNVNDIEAEIAHDGREALEKVEKQDFVCVLSDIKMPQMNGVDLFWAIRDSQPELPVVLMTAYSTDTLVREGLSDGVIAVLNKPLDINLILNFFSSLRKEHSIVIVDDNPKFCKTMGDILRSRGFAVTEISDPNGVIKTLKPNNQVVLLDMKLNSINGLDVHKKIRALYPQLPVVLVTGYREEMTSAIKAALEISAYTCLYKPLQIEELLQVITEIRHQELAKVLS